MDSIARLRLATYAVEHNPSCRMHYLVRLIAPGTGRLDKLCAGQTKDVLGYGRSEREAATRAFRKVDAVLRKIL